MKSFNRLKNMYTYFIVSLLLCLSTYGYAQEQDTGKVARVDTPVVLPTVSHTLDNESEGQLAEWMGSHITGILPNTQEILMGSEYWRWGLCLFTLLLILILHRFILSYLLKYSRYLTGMTKTDLDDQLIEVLQKPVAVLIWVNGLFAMTSWLNITAVFNQILILGYRIAMVSLITWSVAESLSVLATLLNRLTSKSPSKLDDYLVPFVIRVIKIATYSIGVMLVIQEFGVNVAGIIAGLGVGGLAFALAAQDTLANWFGALMIYTDRPFEVKDWIKTDELEGVVIEVGLRSTRIRTFADSVVSIPNRRIADDVIENFTKMDKRRVSMKVGVTYNTTPAMLEESVERIRDILRKHPQVDQSFWLVKFTDFGESALEIFIYYYTMTKDWELYLSIKQDVNLQIMQRLKAIGVEFAFPSMSIYQSSSDPDHIAKLDAQARRLFAARKPQIIDMREDRVAPSEGNAEG